VIGNLVESSQQREYLGSGFEYIKDLHPGFDQNCLDLLEFMLQVEPLERPNCKEILGHAFFDDVRDSSRSMESLGAMFRQANVDEVNN
jgi:hypothetical protein